MYGAQGRRLHTWLGWHRCERIEPEASARNCLCFLWSFQLQRHELDILLLELRFFFDPFTAEVTLPYQLEPQLAFAPANPQWSISDFEPISEIAQTRADLVLLFLSFSGVYMGVVNDPWFSAHDEEYFPDAPTFLQSRFSRDRAISTLGCTAQHQFCTSNKTCTGLGGFDQVQNNPIFNQVLTPHQNATFDRLLRAIAESELQHVVQNSQRTITPLLASNLTTAGASGAVISRQLPDDQWMHEVNFLHSVAMSQLQRSIVQWATGQFAAEARFVVPATEEPDKWFCNNMIIPSVVYSSFSLVAIILILVFGTLIISISMVIDDIAAFFRKKLKRPPVARTWDHFDMLSHRTPIRTRFEPDVLRIRTASLSPRDTVNLQPTRTALTPDIRRISSPTLPPADRALRISSSQPNFSRPYRPNPVEPPPKLSRNSGIAISLNNLDLEATEASTTAQQSDRARRARLGATQPPLLAQPFPRVWARRNDRHLRIWV